MIKLIKSTFYQEKKTKKRLVDFILKTDQLSMGKECAKFEENFVRKQGCKFAIMVSSGSSANLVLIQSLLNLGILKKGAKVGFSALTWATNVMPIIQLGLIPVAIDCELSTLNVSPQNLQKYLGKLQALFLTNALGFCDQIDQLQSLCAKHGIIFLEDNCESLGSKTKGKLLGNFGLASTFSFYVGHHLSTIEGGMICTSNQKLSEMLLMTRAHGWDRNLEERKQQELRKTNKIDDFFSRYTFYDLAYNARPTELNGFIGNEQIEYWDEIVTRRQKNFHLFQNQIEKNSDFIPLKVGFMDTISNFAMPIICKSKKLLEKYKNRFLQSNIEIRPIIAGDITQQPFFKKYVGTKETYPNAELIHRQGFYFPNNPELTKKEIDLFCRLLQK